MTQFEKSFHAALQECFPSEGFSYRSKSFFRWCPDIVQFFSVKWVRYQYTFSFGILPLSFKTLEFNDHVGYSLSKLRAEHIVLPSHIRLGDWTFPIPTKCCETGVLPSYMHLADWTTQELLDSDFAEVVNLVRLEVLPFFQKGQTVTGARAAVEEMDRKYFSAPNSLHEEIAMHFAFSPEIYSELILTSTGSLPRAVNMERSLTWQSNGKRCAGVFGRTTRVPSSPIWKRGRPILSHSMTV